MAAETFSLRPNPSGIGQSLTGCAIERVVGSLDTTVTLLEDRGRCICIISTHAITHFYRYSNLVRRRLADNLSLDVANVHCFSSHNHCAFQPFPPDHPLAVSGRLTEPDMLLETDLTADGLALLNGICATASRLPAKLEHAEIHWSLGHERRISYNRKGYRVDGTPYMIREQDRLRLGGDFNGDIDDDAPIVAFVGLDGRPISFLVSFTAHPVTAYHPEHLVLFGEYAQTACEALSETHQHVPVGFLQGCAGDVNSKGAVSNRPLDESIAAAEQYGHFLGETYRQAAQSLVRSSRQDLRLNTKSVRLPFSPVPPLAELDMQIADIKQFIARCENNDPDTLTCQGLNFPSNMTPRYRAALVQPLLQWASWVRRFHEQDRLSHAPTGVDVEVVAIGVGDIGIIGLPCEPFDAIGRQIKRASPCKLTIPCGYANDDDVFYIPDSGNNGDLEYQSAFYRYTQSLLPYAHPAGDRLTQEAVELLRRMQ